ncbi:MAG: hypothetical protein GX096_10820 [Clostridiales bacterium]|nr:hypothetical protein [Clostridiales bacterium]
MVLQFIWFMMMAGSVVYACVGGFADSILPSAIRGAANSIELIVNLLAGYLLFCGLIEIVKALDVPAKINKLLKPLLRVLMPSIQQDETLQAVTMNISANLLGLGNAATPMGMEAMRRMEREHLGDGGAQHAMYMLLIINATSIQLIPTTILTLRIAAGSADVNQIILPSLLCTIASTVVGVALALICRRRMEKRHA